MKTSVFRLSTLALTLFLVAACGQKKSDDAVRVGAGATIASGPYAPGAPNLPAAGNVIPGAQAQVTPVAGMAITDTVKILMSPSFPAEDIGTVSSVTLSTDISVDRTNGAVIPSPNQGILITIVDSKVGTPSGTNPGQLVQPMTIRMAPTPGGGGMSAGNVNLIFRDETGEIRISGTYDQALVRGTISFTNNQAGYQNQNSGTLGTFQVPVCSFVRCN